MVVSRYLKYFSFLLLSFAIVYGVLRWYPFSGYYQSFPVTYDKYDYPFIMTKWLGRPDKLGVSIGCRFPLFLRQKTLENLDKQFQGMEICRNLNGSQRETSYYLIPKLEVGDLHLKNVIAYQADKEDYDSLGKFLGGEFNLLLDFAHDRIIACDSFSKLQSKKIADQNWIRLPFEMHRSGVLFHVETDFGTCKLVLNTGCTNSVLSSSIFPTHLRFPYVSSSFALAGHQFPNATFYSFEVPQELHEIDGFIGMDFLKEHPMYLDYVHKIVYVAPPHRYFERIPVTFNLRNAPMIDVSLEDNTYSLKLDSGSSFCFSLKSDILQKIHKTKYGTSNWNDFRGNQYESPVYTIPEIKIGGLKFSRVFTNQDSEEFHANTNLIGNPLQLSGMIGLPILQKYNLFLDFPHSAIYASKDLLLLQEAGLFSHDFLAIPFKFHPDGIILSVETDTGVHRLMLDTGTTSTAIRAPHPSSTIKFEIMSHDFGERFIMPIDISAQFDFDGCIGMDFLLEYPIFIDCSNKMVFIDLAKRSREGFSL
jgi:hypothetical protein